MTVMLSETTRDGRAEQQLLLRLIKMGFVGGGVGVVAMHEPQWGFLV